jgi:hypothetical protein
MKVMKNALLLLWILSIFACTKEQSLQADSASAATANKQVPVISEISVTDEEGKTVVEKFYYENGRLIKVADSYGEVNNLFYYAPEKRTNVTWNGYWTTYYYINEKNQLSERIRGYGNDFDYRFYQYQNSRLVADSSRNGPKRPDYRLFCNYYTYQGSRLTSIRRVYKDFKNNIQVGETESYRTDLNWKNPFQVVISYDYNYSLELRSSNTVKSPFYYNSLLPAELVRPSSFSHSQLMGFNNNPVFANFWSYDFEGELNSGMLNIEEIRRFGTTNDDDFRWYKKAIKTNKYHLPEEYIEVFEFPSDWEGGRGSRETKYRFRYILLGDTY